MTVATETDEPGADATARSARLRHLIITVYGLYARHDGGWLSVATLIRLLADLGIDEPAVRSAISRLKRRGILQSRRHDGAAGYQLSAEALAILREGDARIFRRGRATPADGWVLAVFSVPESERHRRHVLRSELTRLGFGMVAPGVWIVPAHPQDTTAETLRRLELDAYADLFRADHLAFGDPAAKVRQWWDLDELERPLRVVHPGARAGPAGPRLGASRGAGGVRRVRPGAHRLAAAPLPGPRAARRAAARGVGRHQGRRAVLRPAGAARGGRPGLRDVRQPLTTAMPWISTSSSGSHSRVTPTAAMAGYSVPASRRQTAPISLACAW